MESALRSLILIRIILMESIPNQDSKTKAGVASSSIKENDLIILSCLAR